MDESLAKAYIKISGQSINTKVGRWTAAKKFIAAQARYCGIKLQFNEPGRV